MSRVKGMFKGAKKLFGSPKKKAEYKAPVQEIAVDEDSEVHTENYDEVSSPVETQKPDPAPDSPEVTAETEVVDRDIVSLPDGEDIYKDDNDGSEKKCCEACEGCIVMWELYSIKTVCFEVLVFWMSIFVEIVCFYEDSFCVKVLSNL